MAAALALAASTLMLTACGGGGATSGSKDVVFRIGSGDTIDSLNPFVAFNQLAYDTFYYTYPSLVQYDKDLKFVPYFASKWTTSPDGKTWTFTVPGDAKWSDGQTLNAQDVAWTLNLVLKDRKGGASSWAGTTANMDKVSAPNDTTVVIKYGKPVANALSQLQQIPILPQQFWGQYTGGKNGSDLTTAKMTPPIISGGPFQVVGYQKNEYIQFKANANYFGTKPQIPGFGIKMYTNSDSMVTDLENNQLDYIDAPPAQNLSELKSKGFTTMSVPGTEWHDFIINSSPYKKDHPELQNLKVREAFEYAINRQDLIDTVWSEAAVPGAAIVPPSTDTAETKWSDPSIKPLPYSPSKANKILDDLGFKKGSNGIRVANGVPMSYTVIVPNSLDKGSRWFQIMQQQFQAIGVQLQAKFLDDSAAFAAVTEPHNTYANFDLALWDWVPMIDPDFILSVLTCEQFGGWSDTGYCNKKYDALYAKQATQINPQDRVKTVYEMQQMIHRDRPYIVLEYSDATAAWSPKWTGLVPSPQGPLNPLSTASLINVHQTS